MLRPRDRRPRDTPLVASSGTERVNFKLAVMAHESHGIVYYRRRLHGGDGGDRPHGQNVVGAMPPSRPHGTFVVIFERVKCAVKYEFIITPVTKVAQISA